MIFKDKVRDKMIIVVIILSNFKQKIYYIVIILIKASLKYNEKHFSDFDRSINDK